MRHRKHSKHDHESTHGIDLAPMLDFVLNLLIFFIITAVFVKELGLMVNRPPPNQPEDDKNSEESIVIQVLTSGEVWMGDRPIDVRAVRANIEREAAVNPKGGVLILAEKDAQTGVLVQVVDQVHLGGIYNITFTTSG